MDPKKRTHVLTLNGGSSSVRFALYDVGGPVADGAGASHDGLQRALHGKLDRIGAAGMSLTFVEVDGTRGTQPLPASRHRSPARLLLDWLASRPEWASVGAVGHRVVHGMQHSEPELVTEALLDELHRIVPYDEEHLPQELELIEELRRHHAELPQVVCFDTAFHRSMPRVATLLPIPRAYQAKGLQRYGFHGLSYAFLMAELARLGSPSAARGRVILAHLGNGASMAAVRDGKSIDTSMGFTPTAGLPMSTRSGDLDPGLVSYLARVEKQTASEFHRMVNKESGLLGVSEISSDMRDLLAVEGTDPRAREAVDLFCYQAKKLIGSFAAALGGVDTLVFAGGIGENAPTVRARTCEGLAFLGLSLDAGRNERTEGVISPDGSPVTVRVIATDEEQVIARAVVKTLGG